MCHSFRLFVRFVLHGKIKHAHHVVHPPSSSERSADADSAHSSDANGATKADGCCRCSKCCTPCFAFLCRPCTKLGRLACCRRCCGRHTKKPAAAGDAQDAAAAAATTNAQHESIKKPLPLVSRLCGCCRRRPEDDNEDATAPPPPAVATMVDETSAQPSKEPGKCALCLSKFLCCRRTNKVQEEQIRAAATATAEAARDAIPARRMCCWCIPCGRKKQPDAGRPAWSERRESILSEPDKR